MAAFSITGQARPLNKKGQQVGFSDLTPGKLVFFADSIDS